MVAFKKNDEKLFDQIKRQFVTLKGTRERRDLDVKGAEVFYNEEYGSSLTPPIVYSLQDYPDFKRLAIYPSSKADSDRRIRPVLQFCFLNLASTDRRTKNRSAASFYELDEVQYVCHTGRIHGGKLKLPYEQTQDERYLVSKVDDIEVLLERMVHFLELKSERENNAKRNLSLKSSTKKKSVRARRKTNPGYDTGADEGAPRARSKKTQALHKKIVEKLILEAELQGCIPSPHSCICKPDLIATRKGSEIKFLFEVKPDHESSSILVAIGQLQTYASEHDVKLNYCAIVIPTRKTESGEGTNKGVVALGLKLLTQLGVSIIEYNRLNGHFHGLKKFVSHK